MSLAVVGTDTEIGKTVVSALVARRFRDADHPERSPAYWKPVASGSIEGRDVETVAELAGCPVHDELYLFADPVSPHLAARREGVEVEPARVVARYAELRRSDPRRPLVVEGIGGVLVPLTDRGDLFADLLPELELPTLLVARSTLGTINHTLLTLEALRRREISVAGVALVGPPDADNRDAIERFGNVHVVAEVPPLATVDAVTVAEQAARFDVDGRLNDAFSGGS